ncbi:MAG: hypothetical protein ABW170_08195 [Candidatus Thiodiazotropha sp. L084R]
MSMQKILFSLILTIILCLPGYLLALPAFPGAEGFGANSVGGRGGEVIKVTNLNDSGPGSLRAALEASGPRIIVFSVSGYINLESVLEIRNPYFTIAGQTSPGGISVTGYPLRILTHDVIITHMRFRRGSHRGDVESAGESLFIGNGYNIIIDHSSLSWGTDETMQVGSYWGDVYGVTISWSIIAEGLQDPHPEPNHGMGLLISDKFYDSMPPEVTVHHSYIAHQRSRSPRLVGDVLVDYRNNVVYDWYHQTGAMIHKGAIDTTKLARANIIGNYNKRGPNGNDNGCVGFFSSNGAVEGGTVPVEAQNSVYVSDNKGCPRPLGTEDEWKISKEWGSDLISTDYQKTTPWDMANEAQQAGIPVTTMTMTEDYALRILQYVGATGPVRDTADARVVQQYIDGNGDLMDDVSYPADFPIFSTPPVPTDSDSDGMADSWESSRGLNASANDAAGDDDGDGYTNIEEYLHYLAALFETPRPNPPTLLID